MVELAFGVFASNNTFSPMRDFLKFFTFNLRIVIVWLLKFRYCEKATKFEKISHLVLKLLSKVKTKWEIFVALSEYLNFKKIYSIRIVLC